MSIKGAESRSVGATAIFVAVLVVVVPQLYLAVAQPNEGWTVFAWAVALPVILGSAAFLAVGNRVYLFVFLAFFWSVTDDAPVNLDSVYTWPEVTSGFQHVASEVLLHALTIFFLFLAVRAAFRLGGNLARGRAIWVWLLTIVAFGAASVSIIPSHPLQAAIAADWYPFDIVGHLVSLAIMFVALRVATK